MNGMHRPSIGIVALILLAVGLFARGQIDDVVAGSCLRIGAVLALLWLAEPQLRRVPTWLVASLFVVLVIVMRWPRLLVAVIPLALLLWWLRPRESSRARD